MGPPSAHNVAIANEGVDTLADEVGANQALKRVLQVYWPHLIQNRRVRRHMVTVAGLGGRIMGIGLMLNDHSVLSDACLYEVLRVNRRAVMAQGKLDPLFVDDLDARQLMFNLFLFDLETDLGLVSSIT